MDKFIGKINGVEYANREEFCKVLGELKPEDIKSISLVEQSTNEEDLPHEEKEPTKSEKKELSNYDTNETIETLFHPFLLCLNILRNLNIVYSLPFTEML